MKQRIAKLCPENMQQELGIADLIFLLLVDMCVPMFCYKIFVQDESSCFVGRYNIVTLLALLMMTITVSFVSAPALKFVTNYEADGSG
jgi:hypothetical protein